MTTLMRNRLRRQTKPADYVTKNRQADAMSWGRPGSRGFSFTGEFPEMPDQQPVEAPSRRREYTADRCTGSYQAVGREDTQRMRSINRYGVQCMTALGMFVVLAVVLGGFLCARLDARGQVMNAIHSREEYIAELTTRCSETRSRIQTRSNDVNIRLQALQMGLISSRGVEVQYLEGCGDHHEGPDGHPVLRLDLGQQIILIKPTSGD